MTVKSPETDNRLVEFLYDEMSPEDRAAFQQQLDTAPDLRREVTSTRAALTLLRRHSVDHPVPDALTERLSAAATRATLPLWRRLLAPFALRGEGKPAFALGLLALVVMGLGAFLVIGRSGPVGPRPGTETVARSEAPALDRAPRTEDTRTVATRQGLLETAKDKNDDGYVATGEGRPDTSVDGLRGGVTSGAGGKAEAPRDQAKAAFGAGRVAKEETERKAAEVQLAVRDQPAPPPSGAPAAPAARRRGLASSAGDDEADKDQGAATRNQKPTTAGQKVPAAALHLLARTNQSKGQLADACSQYGQLVRGYLGYDQRPAALLEWAKCEAARGNHATAETLLRQLIAQYPKFQPAAQQLLANVQNERANVARRAQRATSNVANPTQQRAKPAKKASDTSQ